MATQISETPASLAKGMYTNLSQQYLARLSKITTAYLKVTRLREVVEGRYKQLKTEKVAIPSLEELGNERAGYYTDYRKLRRVYKENGAFEKTLIHGYQSLKADQVTQIFGSPLSTAQLQELQNYASSFKDARDQLDTALGLLKDHELYDFHLHVETGRRRLTYCQLLRFYCNGRPKVDEILKGINEKDLRDTVESMEVEATILSTGVDEKEHKTRDFTKEGTFNVDAHGDLMQPKAREDEFVHVPGIVVPSNLRFRKKVHEQVSSLQTSTSSSKGVLDQNVNTTPYTTEQASYT